MSDADVKLRRALQRKSFGERAGKTSVAIDLVIRDNGDLVLEGQDLGAAPREVFGDSDYEYWLTLRAGDKDRALEELLVEAGDKQSAPATDKDALVIDLLVARFGDSNAPVSELKEWLDARTIPYAFNSY